jgi:RNA polymerase sigma-70 factor (ECF subfamily)
VRAVAKQSLWQEGTNLRAWLFTLMHNQHVNDVRRNVRTGQEIDIDSDGARSLRATTDPSGSRQLMELERALGQLAVEQRQVILLIGMEGMSYEEAASICAVPVGTIRSRLSRGRVALRQLLDMDEIVPALAIANARPELRAVA